MATALLLMLQIVLPALVGVGVSAYLRPVLKPLLVDLCGSEARADFWGRALAVGLILFPCWLTLWSIDPLACHDLVLDLRRIFVSGTAGTLLVVALVATVIWRRIPRIATAPATPATER